MAIKKVKVGERYKLELLCISTSHHIAFETPTGNKVAISKHDLECVSPVAEPEPYSVQESYTFNIVRDGKIVKTITEDDYFTFEQAKVAAEVDCIMLNKEHRMEMGK